MAIAALNIVARAAGFSNVSRAITSLSGSTSGLVGVFARLNKGFLVASASATLAIVAMKGISSMFQKATEDVRKYVNIAYTMRASVGDIAKLAERFRMAGSNIDKMKVNIYSLQQALENKEKANVFTALGIDDLNSFKTKGAVEQMEIILDKLSQISSASARSRAAMKIFGFRSQEMGQVIDQTRYMRTELGEDTYQKILGGAKELLDKYGTTLAQVSYNWQAFWRQMERFFTGFFATLSPTLLGITNDLLKWGKDMAKVGAEWGIGFADVLNEWLPQIVKAFNLFADTIKIFYHALAGALSFLAGLADNFFFLATKLISYIPGTGDGNKLANKHFKTAVGEFADAELHSMGLEKALRDFAYHLEGNYKIKKSMAPNTNEITTGSDFNLGDSEVIKDKYSGPDFTRLQSAYLDVGGYANSVEASAAMSTLSQTIEQQQLVETQKSVQEAQKISSLVSELVSIVNKMSQGISNLSPTYR